jgi:hypothetical protein
MVVVVRSTSGCGFNRSMQHLNSNYRERAARHKPYGGPQYNWSDRRFHVAIQPEEIHWVIGIFHRHEPVVGRPIVATDVRSV